MKNSRVSTAFLSPEAISRWPRFPSAQTMYRCHLLDPRVGETVAQTAARLNQDIRDRDRENVLRIERAGTVDELLDLVPVASGTATPSWRRRMRQFGQEAVYPIAQRLRHTREIEDRHRRSMTYELLLSALRWKEETGASALLDCFDVLSPYGQSLACVSLGVLDAGRAIPTIWAYYESVWEDTGENYLVGALWGLIDLQDPRVADALSVLLVSGRYFFELFGFLSLAGDVEAVVPLLLLSMSDTEMNEMVPEQAAMALLSIAHRIGRDSLWAEFEQAGAGRKDRQRQLEGFVDSIMSIPPETAEKYFSLFYRGLQLEDLDLDEMRAVDRRFRRFLGDEYSLKPGSPSPPYEKPGRNDPCWCGSGKKYKYCHLRKDQRRHRLNSSQTGPVDS